MASLGAKSDKYHSQKRRISIGFFGGAKNQLGICGWARVTNQGGESVLVRIAAPAPRLSKSAGAAVLEFTTFAYSARIVLMSSPISSGSVPKEYYILLAAILIFFGQLPKPSGEFPRKRSTG